MFSDPQKNVESFGLLPGTKVADFGAGSGFYSIAAAKAVGGSGRVYAVDIQKDLLTKLQNEGRRQGAVNIEIVWGDVEKPGGAKIRDNGLDAVIIGNLLFQLEKKEETVREAYRILKPRGKVLVVDWTDSFGGLGPRPADVVTEAKALELFRAAGFEKVRTIPAGAHHYGIIFEKK